MSHSPNLFPLKLVVISLGVLLIGAIVFVLVTITGRLQDAGGKHCDDASIKLDGRGLVGITPQGSHLELTLKDGGAVKILTIDKCTGAVLQTFTVAP